MRVARSGQRHQTGEPDTRKSYPSGSEGGGWKRAAWHLASRLPYLRFLSRSGVCRGEQQVLRAYAPQCIHIHMGQPGNGGLSDSNGSDWADNSTCDPGPYLPVSRSSMCSGARQRKLEAPTLQ
jgi:hypothetical protein